MGTPPDCELMTVYWATLLDNVIAGYDASTHSFSKDALPFLRFKDRCYFVTKKELPLGIEKAKNIALSVAAYPDTLPLICVVEAQFPKNELVRNDTGGFGMYRLGSTFFVSALFLVGDQRLTPFSDEELLELQQRKGGKT
jgi:hypothetical protein